MANYAAPQYRASIANGAFDIQSQKWGLGFEAGVDFSVSNIIFVGTSLRYQPFRMTVYSINTTPTLYTNPALFTWERRYAAYTVPLSVGFHIPYKDRTIGEARIGAAFGVLSTSSATNRGLLDRIAAVNPDDTLDVYLWIPANDNPSFFFSTLDASAIWYPLRDAPGLGLGVQAAVQLSQRPAISHSGRMENITTHTTYRYDLSYTTRFASVGMNVTYKWGTKRKKNLRTKFDCPKG